MIESLGEYEFRSILSNDDFSFVIHLEIDVLVSMSAFGGKADIADPLSNVRF